MSRDVRVVRVRPKDEQSAGKPRSSNGPDTVRRRLSDPDPRVARGLIALSALLGLAVVVQLVLVGSGGPDSDVDRRDAAAEVARTGVDAVMKVSAGEPLPLGVFAPELESSLASGSESFLAALSSAGLALSGSPVQVAAVTVTDREAEVLVATNGEIRDGSGRAMSAHQMTFDVSLTKADDEWLISGIEVLS